LLLWFYGKNPNPKGWGKKNKRRNENGGQTRRKIRIREAGFGWTEERTQGSAKMKGLLMRGYTEEKVSKGRADWNIWGTKTVINIIFESRSFCTWELGGKEPKGVKKDQQRRGRAAGAKRSTSEDGVKQNLHPFIKIASGSGRSLTRESKGQNQKKRGSKKETLRQRAKSICRPLCLSIQNPKVRKKLGIFTPTAEEKQTREE